MICAEVDVIRNAATKEMAGPVAEVVNVYVAETPGAPLPPAEITAKLYAVEGSRFDNTMECAVTSGVADGVRAPKATDVPYSICDVEGTSVVQRMVAEVEVMLLAITEPIAGGAAAVVVKVKLGEVVAVDAAPEMTAKLYAVFGERPVSVTT